MSRDYSDIQKVLDSSAGAPLKDFLLGKLMELKDISNISEKDTATHQALELKSQKRAYEKLKEIMVVIMTFSEEPVSDDPRDSFKID